MAATTEPTPEPTRNSTSIDVEKAPPPQPEQKDGDDEFPTFRKLVFILIAIYLSMFIVALVGIPHIPSISNVALNS
jgi:hypothetical protein